MVWAGCVCTMRGIYVVWYMYEACVLCTLHGCACCVLYAMSVYECVEMCCKGCEYLCVGIYPCRCQCVGVCVCMYGCDICACMYLYIWMYEFVCTSVMSLCACVPMCGTCQGEWSRLDAWPDDPSLIQANHGYFRVLFCHFTLEPESWGATTDVFYCRAQTTAYIFCILCFRNKGLEWFQPSLHMGSEMLQNMRWKVGVFRTESILEQVSGRVRALIRDWPS